MGGALRPSPVEASRLRGPLRLCQKARERNWGEQALWLYLFPVSARLAKRNSAKKGNAKGTQSHGLRACT